MTRQNFDLSARTFTETERKRRVFGRLLLALAREISTKLKWGFYLSAPAAAAAAAAADAKKGVGLLVNSLLTPNLTLPSKKSLPFPPHPLTAADSVLAGCLQPCLEEIFINFIFINPWEERWRFCSGGFLTLRLVTVKPIYIL